MMKNFKLLVLLVTCSVFANLSASSDQALSKDGNQEKSAKILTPEQIAAKQLNDKLSAVTNARRAAEEQLKIAVKAEEEEYLQAGRYGFLKSLSLLTGKLVDAVCDVPSNLNKAFWGPEQEKDNFVMKIVKNYSAHCVLAVAAVGTGYVVYQRLTAPKKAKNKVVVE